MSSDTPPPSSPPLRVRQIATVVVFEQAHPTAPNAWMEVDALQGLAAAEVVFAIQPMDSATPRRVYALHQPTSTTLHVTGTTEAPEE